MPTDEEVLDAVIYVRLPAELRDAVRELAKADERSTSAYVRRLLEAHVLNARPARRR